MKINKKPNYQSRLYAPRIKDNSSIESKKYIIQKIWYNANLKCFQEELQNPAFEKLEYAKILKHKLDEDKSYQLKQARIEDNKILADILFNTRYSIMTIITSK